MTCAVCGTANDSARKYCRECGTRLALLCPSCQSPNAAEDKFCGDCGSPLASDPAAGRAGSAAGGSSGTSAAASTSGDPAATGRSDDTERRLVSVLFVDLVGFTPFSESRDAEDVRAMLSQYFDAAADAITRHGGRVEKYIGDAVMAVWGTPVAHEDDAERAVRSALEIVDRVSALGRAEDLDLKARAGVLTGEAVAQRDATDQGLVTGDLVNTAARLQSAAQPGQVLVGERTHRAVSASIACVPVDPLALKGKSEQLAAWRAVRVISELGGSNRGTAPEPPFVGRDEELRLIKELLHATGREGRPRLLHVTGVAGIGKSRLVWELAKYVDGLTETFLWHDGRCPAYGDGVTFWALAEMVRGRARIADTDDDETARRALGVCLDEFVPDAEERRWIEPRLAHLLGMGTGGTATADREELFGAWRRFFERVAEQDTVVLVFEDLQWADTGLLDFVDSLLEWSRTSPIVVLSLARPELADRRPGWGSGVRNSSVLHLDRLSDGGIEEMVTGYVDGLPAEGLARLVARAEGVPMYAVETVRMLAARGVLEQVGETYVTVGELGGELDIPETLHALVAARLDTLPDGERGLVQDASVAGHSFTLDTVAAVAGRDRADVEPLLRTLVRKEVLDQDVDPRSAERGQYKFVQSVIQEVAYSTLSKAARRTKHLACAEWFKALGEEEIAGVVASHLMDAYRANPGADDAEDVARDARTWLLRACDRALSLGSPEQALSYADQGLALASSPADRAALGDRAARAAVMIDAPDAWERITAARDDLVAVGDASAEAQLLVLVHRTIEDSTRLLGWLVDLESRLPEDRRSDRAQLLAALAVAEGQLGAIEASVDFSEQAMIVAETLDDGDPALRNALNGRFFAMQHAGRHIEARLFLEAGLEMTRQSGSPFAIAQALTAYSVGIAEDDPRGSFTAAIECAELAHAAGVRPLELLALGNASEVAVDIGEWDLAERALATSAEYTSGADHADDGEVMSRAMLDAHRGRHQEAAESLEALRAQRGEAWGIVTMWAWWHRVRAVCRFLAGDDHGATEDAAEAIRLEPAGVNASVALWIAVIAGAARRDAAAITAAVADTGALRGQWTRIARSSADAFVAALTDASGATADIESALAAWTAADLPLDHAFTTLSALYVRPDAVPAADVEAARAYLEQRRAVALLARFDDAAPAAC